MLFVIKMKGDKKMKRFISVMFLVGALLGVSIFGFFGVAGATTYSASDIKNGYDSNTFVTASGALELKSLAGFTGVGTSSGPVAGEIDYGVNDWIKINFASPVSLQEITLGTLFANRNYGDNVNEIAKIEYGPGLNDFVTLQATGATTYIYSGLGSVTNLSFGTDTYGGVWKITNPFGGQAVNYIKFTALDGGLGRTGSDNSDFDVVSVSTTSVPEPTSLLLLGFGLVGLAGLSRKLRK
jgi:hypothetical protein